MLPLTTIYFNLSHFFLPSFVWLNLSASRENASIFYSRVLGKMVHNESFDGENASRLQVDVSRLWSELLLLETFDDYRQPRRKRGTKKKYLLILLTLSALTIETRKRHKKWTEQFQKNENNYFINSPILWRVIVVAPSSSPGKIYVEVICFCAS